MPCWKSGGCERKDKLRHAEPDDQAQLSEDGRTSPVSPASNIHEHPRAIFSQLYPVLISTCPSPGKPGRLPGRKREPRQRGRGTNKQRFSAYAPRHRLPSLDPCRADWASSTGALWHMSSPQQTGSAWVGDGGVPSSPMTLRHSTVCVVGGYLTISGTSVLGILDWVRALVRTRLDGRVPERRFIPRYRCHGECRKVGNGRHRGRPESSMSMEAVT
ncbi:hypothetical protein QBC39DRAFT_11515 [Podospora conica]|nr:hypothetical protein QBC39DRAFT_11515 [Schizothecium conicum]